MLINLSTMKTTFLNFWEGFLKPWCKGQPNNEDILGKLGEDELGKALKGLSMTCRRLHPHPEYSYAQQVFNEHFKVFQKNVTPEMDFPAYEAYIKYVEDAYNRLADKEAESEDIRNVQSFFRDFFVIIASIVGDYSDEMEKTRKSA